MIEQKNKSKLNIIVLLLSIITMLLCTTALTNIVQAETTPDVFTVAFDLRIIDENDSVIEVPKLKSGDISSNYFRTKKETVYLQYYRNQKLKDNPEFNEIILYQKWYDALKIDWNIGGPYRNTNYFSNSNYFVDESEEYFSMKFPVVVDKIKEYGVCRLDYVVTNFMLNGTAMSPSVYTVAIKSDLHFTLNESVNTLYTMDMLYPSFNDIMYVQNEDYQDNKQIKVVDVKTESLPLYVWDQYHFQSSDNYYYIMDQYQQLNNYLYSTDIDLHIPAFDFSNPFINYFSLPYEIENYWIENAFYYGKDSNDYNYIDRVTSDTTSQLYTSCQAMTLTNYIDFTQQMLNDVSFTLQDMKNNGVDVTNLTYGLTLENQKTYRNEELWKDVKVRYRVVESELQYENNGDYFPYAITQETYKDIQYLFGQLSTIENGDNYGDYYRIVMSEIIEVIDYAISLHYSDAYGQLVNYIYTSSVTYNDITYDENGSISSINYSSTALPLIALNYTQSDYLDHNNVTIQYREVIDSYIYNNDTYYMTEIKYKTFIVPFNTILINMEEFTTWYNSVNYFHDTVNKYDYDYNGLDYDLNNPVLSSQLNISLLEELNEDILCTVTLDYIKAYTIRSDSGYYVYYRIEEVETYDFFIGQEYSKSEELSNFYNLSIMGAIDQEISVIYKLLDYKSDNNDSLSLSNIAVGDVHYKAVFEKNQDMFVDVRFDYYDISDTITINDKTYNKMEYKSTTIEIPMYFTLTGYEDSFSIIENPESELFYDYLIGLINRQDVEFLFTHSNININATESIDSDRVYTLYYNRNMDYFNTVTLQFPSSFNMSQFSNYITYAGQTLIVYQPIVEKLSNAEFSNNVKFGTFYNDFLKKYEYYADSKTAYIGFDNNFNLETVLDNDKIYNLIETEKVSIKINYYTQMRMTLDRVNDYMPLLAYVSIINHYPTGHVLDINDYRYSDNHYQSYDNALPFYSNLYNCKFLGWDKNLIGTTITSDVEINGQYELPTINVYLYDSTSKLVHTYSTNFTLLTAREAQQQIELWDNIVEVFRNLLLLRFGDIVDDIKDKAFFDLVTRKLGEFSNDEITFLLPVLSLDLENKELKIDKGILQNNSTKIDSNMLAYMTGTAGKNNMMYMLNVYAIGSSLYEDKVSVDIKYGVVLDKVVDTAEDVVDGYLEVFDSIGEWFSDNYKFIIISVLIGLALFIIYKFLSYVVFKR